MSILNLLGITNAYAAAAPAKGSSLMSLLPMFLILFLLMYFIIIRPQSKRTKQHKELLANLKTGDEVITNGGMLGKIVKISDNFMTIEIAEGVKITVQKAAVTTSVPKGTIKAA